MLANSLASRPGPRLCSTCGKGLAWLQTAGSGLGGYRCLGLLDSELLLAYIPGEPLPYRNLSSKVDVDEMGTIGQYSYVHVRLEKSCRALGRQLSAPALKLHLQQTEAAVCGVGQGNLLVALSLTMTA